MAVYLGSDKVRFNQAIPVRKDDSVLDSIIDRTISMYGNLLISEIGSYTFHSCVFLTTVDSPQVATVGSYAFNYCTSLTTVNIPQIVSIGSYAFAHCSALTTINLPKATLIEGYAFGSCYNLLSLYLLGSSIPTLSSTAFYSTPISTYTTSTGGVYGSIFVPASLYSDYLVASGWSIYSSRIVSQVI